MATLSRSQFFTLLVSTGALLLSGCGGSTDKNSFYTGVYRSTYSIPTTGEDGTFNFSVSLKGDVSGNMISNTGVVREVNGDVDLKGEFDAGTFVKTTDVRGNANGVFVSFAVIDVPGVVRTPTPVQGGNFTLRESGRESAVSFNVIVDTTGGVTPTPSPTFAPTPQPVVSPSPVVSPTPDPTLSPNPFPSPLPVGSPTPLPSP